MSYNLCLIDLFEEYIYFCAMFRINRSKTEANEESIELGEKMSWSLVPRSKSTPKNRSEHANTELKLPKLKKIELS